MDNLANVTTNVAEELAEQLKDGTAELVEVKSSNLKSNLLKAGVLLLTAGGSFGLGFGLGKLNERKKWESFDEDEDEDFDDFEDDDEDYVEYVETEPTDTKEAEKADEPEEK